MKTLRTVIYSLTLKQTSLTLKERSMARQNKTNQKQELKKMNDRWNQGGVFFGISFM